MSVPPAAPEEASGACSLCWPESGAQPTLLALHAGLVALPLWGLANWFRLAVPAAWAWALGLHVFSWFAQVVFGHQMAEHRRPALLDSFFQVSAGSGSHGGVTASVAVLWLRLCAGLLSICTALSATSRPPLTPLATALLPASHVLLQSLVLAPLFVWFELLFLLGYRRRLHAEVQVLVLAAIEEWKKHHQPLLAGTDASTVK